MAKAPEPVVLDLASLPREQVGPFLLLGLTKESDKDRIEANWADRLKWARKNLIKVPLEDINWARDILNDRDKRIRADAASLNVDTADGLLTSLAKRFGVDGSQNGRAWQPLDREKALADYKPAAEVPEINTIRAALTIPQTPEELPAVAGFLERLALMPLDPWAIELPR